MGAWRQDGLADSYVGRTLTDWAPDGERKIGHRSQIPGQTGRLTVGHKLTSI
jgi:hypothetical protein